MRAWTLIGARYRVPGLVLAGVSALLCVARYGYGFAPDAMVWPVFAVSSLYIEQRRFAWITNNVTDEWAMVGLLTGLVMGVLARKQSPVGRPESREAFAIAVWAQAVALLVAILFTFGIDFLKAVVSTLPVFPVAYAVARSRLRRRSSSSVAN